MLDRKKIKDVYELTPLQKGILFHYVKDGGSSAYFEQMTLFLEGSVIVSHLEDSLNGLIEKYDALRTNFIFKNVNEPMQVVWKEKLAKVTYKDISTLTGPEQENFLTTYKQEDRRRGFDLTHELLIRFTLIKTGPTKYQLIWSHHHIIMDGWCFSILFNDLLNMYQNLLEQQPIRIEAVTPFSEYIHWLGQQDQEIAVDYWSGYLEGIEETTSLAPQGMLGKSASNDYSKAESSISLSAEQTAELNALAKRYQVTLNSVFQSTWAILLHNYNDTDDVVFGSVVSGRSTAIRNIEHIVGLFINTLPVRVRGLDVTFEELVKSMHEAGLEAGQYEYVSLSEIQKVAGTSGPLFDHILAFENYPLDEDMMSRSQALGFSISDLDVFEQTNYNAHVLIMPANEMTVKISYNENIYARSAIERLLSHWEQIINQVIARTDILVQDIEILTQTEKMQLMQLGHRRCDYPSNSTVHMLFEQQAELTPSHPALLYEDEMLTYEEVNKRANQLAHYLLQQGVKPGDLIGIAMERSIHLYVNILGILKSGAAYVPLDLNYPAERLAYLLEDSGAVMLLTEKEHLPKLSDYRGEVICFDQVSSEINRQSRSNPSLHGSSDDLAYVMYTSGSTGIPKGVSVVHRGIVRLVKNNDFAILDGNQTLLQLAPIAFDASTLEIWGSLLNGGRLAVMPPGLPTVKQIAAALLKYEVTTLWLTSGLFTLVVDHELDSLRGLKQLLVGGDVVSVPHVHKVRQLGGVQVINGYGPTENTTFTCCYSVPEGWTGTALPIGRPIQNTDVYVLNSQMKLVPEGAVGELYVGGDGLARGYWNRSDLTEERFLTHPFSLESNARLYRTGDLVRYLPDGNLEFLGRIDNQVKIRGYRIELGEIEAALAQHPQVKGVVVHVTEEKQLIAYLVLEQSTDNQEDTVAWRSYLQDLLPEYMIPAVYMVLESFPLTPNGKVDRRLLPSPAVELRRTADYGAPTTEAEKLLAQVWQEVLKVNQVGVHDHFFELGGDSIHAIQVAARLHRQKYKLELKDLFQHPTIAELASYLKREITYVEQGAVKGYALLTPIQHWFFEKNIKDRHHWNQAMLLKRKEGWHVSAVNKAIRQLLRHHDALRTVYSEKDGQISAYNRGIQESGFEVTVFDFTNEKDFKAAMEREANQLQRSFKLEEGPLMTAAIFQSPMEDYLLLIVHHLVVDGVSWRILIEDFNTVYEQAFTHINMELPAKTTSYLEWSQALQKYGNDVRFLREQSYWHTLMKKQPAKLPIDQDGEEIFYLKDYASLQLHLDEDTTRLLLTDVHRAYHTQVNDILLAALVLTIQEWTGRSDILLALEGHGREEIIPGIDLTRTVGWFTTIFPVIFEANSKDTSNIIRVVKETLRRIPNKGIGYGILKYISTPQEDAAVLADLKPEISFNYLGQFNKDQGEGFIESSMPIGETVSPWTASSYKLEINGMVTGGELKLEFGYNSSCYYQETIHKLVERYQHHLLGCIEHCLKTEEQWTPSDYAMPKLSFEELETIHQVWRPEVIQSMSYLAPMQEGMLFHHLKDQGSSVYFEQIDFQMKGSMDLICLEESVNALIHKYDILRTVFYYEGLNRPVQLVIRDRAMNVHYEDISHLEKAEQSTYVESFKERDRQTGMDLMKDQLIRFSLIKLDEGNFHLIWSFHHILIDGWCLGIVLNDLLEMYQYRLQQKDIPFAKVTPYSEYIQWLENQNREEARDQWRQYLSGYDQIMGIPSKDNQSNKPASIVEEQSFTIERELVQELVKLARKSQVTQNTVFRTIWGILLQRYNQSKDVVFGAVVSGRSSSVSDIEKIVGLFINTIPIRVQSKPNDTFMSLLHRVQQEASNLEPYSYLSLSDIQSMSGISNGLFNHIVAFENYPLDTKAIDDKSAQLGFSIQDTVTYGQTNFDLDVMVLPGEEMTLKVNYNPAVYENDMIQRLFGHLLQIIRQVTASPEIPLHQIEVVSAAEKQQLIAFNDNAMDYPRDKTIHQLFEEQVERTPDHIAVVCGSEKLTYSELNGRANQLAATLRDNHVTRESIVGILVKPSLDMLVAILGVLKAGGAYLPIDPAYPGDRIQYMLLDSQAEWLLTQEGLEVPAGYAGKIMLLNHTEGWNRSTENLMLINEATDMAYVIYTSGSTGRPKGVMVEHGSLVNLAFWHNQAFEITEKDRSTKFAGFGFDASVWEIFPYLIKGASLYMIAEAHRYDVNLLSEYYEQEGITISFLPTQFAEQFMNITNRSLRTLLIGGERAQRIPKVPYQVVNNYGPTENTVCATSHVIDHEDMMSPPIGRPIANNRIYILDSNDQLQPVGIAGELCIAGESVARGYLNQPELTAEKFVINPFVPGERMYKTGDLARWTPSGVIEYIGRRDDQIKIRGYRIELGEIESQILHHTAVREAVVLARQNAQGLAYLIAYFTVKQPITIAELRQFMETTLPAYMIPGHLIELAELPLTANGKVDRKALPEPELQAEQVCTPPRNEQEQILVNIWREVLQTEAVGIHDNFFVLGGDSIKAIQVAARLHRHGMKLEVNQLFQNPTIFEVAPYLKVTGTLTEQGPVQGKVHLTPIQQWFFEQSFDDLSHWNQDMLLFRPEGYEIEAIERAFQKLAEHHDALRMRYKKVEDNWSQENLGLDESHISLRVFDLTGTVNVAEQLEREANLLHRSLSIEEGPLVQLGLFKAKQGDYLLIIIHHLIVDGVSWRILLEDFETAYQQVLDNEPVRLAPKTTSFQAWTRELQRYASDEKLLREIPYWSAIQKTQVDCLPKDRPGQEIYPISIAATVQVELTEAETRSLLTDSHLAYQTEINDLLLTALVLTLREWGRIRNVAIDLEGHGREEIIEGVDLTRTVGWFTSMYPIVFTEGFEGISHAIKLVKESLRQIPNKGIGYGILKYLTSDATHDLPMHLQPEVSFNYLGQFQQGQGEGLGQGSIKTGDAVSPSTTITYSLSINGMVMDERLRIIFGYNPYQFDLSSVQEAAYLYQQQLLNVIHHCMGQEETERTPSDFSMDNLSFDELDQIFEALKEKA